MNGDTFDILTKYFEYFIKVTTVHLNRRQNGNGFLLILQNIFVVFIPLTILYKFGYRN